jgi:stress response protein YsnF
MSIRQLIQTSPAKANELFAKLVDTSDSAVKTRERLFSELKEELELLASLEEKHLFPVLRKHKETKGLIADALHDNSQTRKLLAELEQTPKNTEEFASKVTELRKTFQQHVRDEKKELLPAVLKALSDEEMQTIVENIEGEKAEIEEAKRAEAEQRRAAARQEREQAEEEAARAQQTRTAERHTREAARRTIDAVVHSGEVVAENSRSVVQSAAETTQRLATAPLRTGSLFLDVMLGMWAPQQGRSVGFAANAQPASEGEEIIPLAEETLVVGKHTVNRGTTRVHRYVVETPVEQEVSLTEERVVVERRKPATDAVTGETFTEVTVEMIDTAEVPVVAKGVRVKEEVVIRKERTERVTTVRDTVRRDEVEIERSDVEEHSPRKRPALAYNRR